MADFTPEEAEFHRRYMLCEECDSEICLFNPEGKCLYPILKGRKPCYVDGVGCDGCIVVGPEFRKERSK